MLDPESFLFVTLDSCRYDTFASAAAPNLKAVGPVYQAMAPGNFTYSSHSAMFVGFTPGVASIRKPYVNPKYGKIFRLEAGFRAKSEPFVALNGRNIIDGLKRQGYLTFGTGAAGWFNPNTPTGRLLTHDFDRYYYPGDTHSLIRQLDWIEQRLREQRRGRVFVFLNVGETHVPYYYNGAPWSRLPNPCVPFGDQNDPAECRRRQTACLEFADARLSGLLEQFHQANTVVCADHGDAWGEDGLWEHGIHHPAVMEVPLVFRLNQPPPGLPRPVLALPYWRRLVRRVRRVLRSPGA